MKECLMRDGLEDDFGLLEVQNGILSIMKYIDSFCVSNDIRYCLMGGSALGAMRHGGFIPWDDDLDIFMTPDQYEKFRLCFNFSGDHEKYYLQEWGLSEGMVTIAKIRRNGTTYIEDSLKDWDIHHGFYVDIFILHNCPNGLLPRYWQFFWAKYVITKGLALRKHGRHKGLKGFLISFSSILPKRFLVKFALKQVYRYRYSDSKYYCNFLGKAGMSNGRYRKWYYEELVRMPFETLEFYVPVHLHEFLSDRFGDYMQIPSSDQIKWEQHCMEWDLNRQFKISDDYLDEKYLI